jgi:hypothetical protein
MASGWGKWIPQNKLHNDHDLAYQDLNSISNTDNAMLSRKGLEITPPNPRLEPTPATNMPRQALAFGRGGVRRMASSMALVVY